MNVVVMIDSYEFGSIIINGKAYTSDIIIFPDGKVKASWWRKEGHSLSIEDIIDLVQSAPELIIVGTGAYGFMKAAKELESQLKDKGIELKTAPTDQAMKLYNALYQKRKLGACFHLTC
jgi:hypothetical protein